MIRPSSQPAHLDALLEWSSTVAKRARGEVLDPHEQETYQRGHASSLAAEEAVWQGLGRLGAQRLPEEQTDEDLLAQTLAVFHDNPATTKVLPLRRPLPRRSRRSIGFAWIAGIAASLLCAISFAAYQLWSDHGLETPPSLVEHVGENLSAGGKSALHRAELQVNRQNTEPTENLPAPEPALPATEEAKNPSDTSTESAANRQTELGSHPETMAPKPARPSADKLLQTAQLDLAAGRRTQAIADYRALQRAFPRSPEARLSYVSLGKLLLSSGQAEAALSQFAAYLRSGRGELTEEAFYGRVLALRQLGRAVEERMAILDFLDNYPHGVHASHLKKRLADLPAN